MEENRFERDRQEDWDRRNLRTVSTHLTVRQAKQLQKYCDRHGVSRYHLLKDFLLRLIAEDR